MYLIIILLVLLLLVVCLRKKEKFTDEELQMKMDDLYDNKSMFDNKGTYSNARKKMSWLDPVLYDIMVKEYKKNKFNKRESMKSTLSQLLP